MTKRPPSSELTADMLSHVLGGDGPDLDRLDEKLDGFDSDYRAAIRTGLVRDIEAIEARVDDEKDKDTKNKLTESQGARLNNVLGLFATIDEVEVVEGKNAAAIAALMTELEPEPKQDLVRGLFYNFVVHGHGYRKLRQALRPLYDYPPEQIEQLVDQSLTAIRHDARDRHGPNLNPRQRTRQAQLNTYVENGFDLQVALGIFSTRRLDIEPETAPTQYRLTQLGKRVRAITKLPETD